MKINEDKHSVNKLTDISKFNCVASLYAVIKRSCGFCAILAISVLFSVSVIAEPTEATPSTFTMPLWKTGNTWKVRTWLPLMTKGDFVVHDKSEPIDAIFRVAGFKTVNEKDCVEIRVTFPKDETGFKEMYLLYFRRDLQNLIRIVDCSIKSNGLPNHRLYVFTQKPNHPIIANSVPSTIPFDFPIITNEQGETFVEHEGKKIQQKIEKISNGIKVIIVQKTKHGEIKCVQTWLKNSPWWHDLKKYKDGELIYEAIMIDEQ